MAFPKNNALLTVAFPEISHSPDNAYSWDNADSLDKLFRSVRMYLIHQNGCGWRSAVVRTVRNIVREKYKVAGFPKSLQSRW